MLEKIKIDDSVIELLPSCRVGVLTASVSVHSGSAGLDSLKREILSDVERSLATDNEKELSVILQTRKAYKLCGKEPSRYRPSAEALLRRVRTGKGLYAVNNVVDIINLLSMCSQFSIGGFDAAMIDGDVILAIGDQAPYEAIGRGQLNIEFMPGLKDKQGFFGTPTSDSVRTMINPEMEKLALVFYDFMNNDGLLKAMDQAEIWLSEHCNGTEIDSRVVG